MNEKTEAFCVDPKVLFEYMRQFIGAKMKVSESMGQYTASTLDDKVVLSSACRSTDRFYCSPEKLAPHVGHSIVCVGYGQDEIVNISIECEDCNEVLFDVDAPADEPDGEPKGVFFFCMTVCNRRTGVPLGKRCGIVFAGSGEEAERIAWEKYGNDASCQLWIAQVPDDGFEFPSTRERFDAIGRRSGGRLLRGSAFCYWPKVPPKSDLKASTDGSDEVKRICVPALYELGRIFAYSDKRCFRQIRLLVPMGSNNAYSIYMCRQTLFSSDSSVASYRGVATHIYVSKRCFRQIRLSPPMEVTMYICVGKRCFRQIRLSPPMEVTMYICVGKRCFRRICLSPPVGLLCIYLKIRCFNL